MEGYQVSPRSLPQSPRPNAAAYRPLPQVQPNLLVLPCPCQPCARFTATGGALSHHSPLHIKQKNPRQYWLIFLLDSHVPNPVNINSAGFFLLLFTYCKLKTNLSGILQRRAETNGKKEQKTVLRSPKCSIKRTSQPSWYRERIRCLREVAQNPSIEFPTTASLGHLRYAISSSQVLFFCLCRGSKIPNFSTLLLSGQTVQPAVQIWLWSQLRLEEAMGSQQSCV